MSTNDLLFILLSKGNSYIELDKLYSSSSHKIKAKEILNSILYENPEYYPTICCLATYNIQKWASEQRENTHINFDNFVTNILVFENQDDESTLRLLKFQSITLKNTNEAMKYLKEIIDPATKEGKSIYSIHFNGEEVSKYLINNYYKKAVLNLCEKHNEYFKKLLGGEMLEPYLNGNNDSDIAYHNTQILLKLLPRLIKKRVLPNELISSIKDQLIKCLETIKTANDGEETYQILGMYLKGMSEVKIAKKFERNRKYIHAKIKYGTELLSYVIWGYGTREIMSNISKHNN